MKTYYRTLKLKIRPIHVLYGFFLLIATMALIYRIYLQK